MEEIKKVLEALEKGDEKLLLSDVSCSFTIGDLKQMLLSAIVKGRMIANGGEKILPYSPQKTNNMERSESLKKIDEVFHELHKMAAKQISSPRC